MDQEEASGWWEGRQERQVSGQGAQKVYWRGESTSDLEGVSREEVDRLSDDIEKLPLKQVNLRLV